MTCCRFGTQLTSYRRIFLCITIPECVLVLQESIPVQSYTERFIRLSPKHKFIKSCFKTIFEQSYEIAFFYEIKNIFYKYSIMQYGTYLNNFYTKLLYKKTKKLVFYKGINSRYIGN